MSEDQRRLTFVRDNVERLAEEKHNLESLLTALQLGSEEDSQEILRRLRSGTDSNQLAQQVHAGQALADVRSEGGSPIKGTLTPNLENKDVFVSFIIAIAYV